MVNVVITRNTTPQFTPYGAIDTHFVRMDDTHIDQGNPPAVVYGDTRALGPTDAELLVGLLRADDMHQIPSNAINIVAELHVHMAGGGFGTFDVGAHRLSKHWLQYATNFNGNTLELLWETAGALGASDRGAIEGPVVEVSTEEWLIWPIPIATAFLIANPSLNYGVGLYPVQPGNAFRFWDGSISGADGLRPEWHISYDEPVAGGGAGGLKRALIKGISLVKSAIKSLIKGSGGSGPNPVPTVDERNIMVFGHSLFDHGLFGSNEFTKTGWAMGDMSRQSFNFISIGLIFNQLRDQTIPPPYGSLTIFGTNQIDPWPNAGDAWDVVGWDDALLMASNFEQETKTPATFATESDPVLDYIDTNSPSTNQIIYEHWAESSQYGIPVLNDNEMTPANWLLYKDLHRDGGDYHTWHVDYQDAIQTNGYTIFMIPVGPIIFDALQTEAYLSAIEFEDLFVDEAPHGNANMYFLAGLVTYIAMFGAPNTAFAPMHSAQLNSAITNNVSSLIPFIESRLTFYGANGVNLP